MIQEFWIIALYPVAAISLLVPALTESHWGRMFGFLIFEMCVGVFWPSMGLMRSRLVSLHLT